eukprot:29663-Amphidinium_carterae.1
MPLRPSSRSRASRQASGARRGESLGPTSRAGGMPSASGLPTQFGPDSSGRSRSARRQRPEESSAAPEGEEDLQDHDFVDDIDFAEEDVMPEVIPEEEGFRDDDDEDVQYLYAERPGAMEVRVEVDYNKIQSEDARPDRIIERPPWWRELLRYRPVGGITKAMCESRSNWETMTAGVRDPGYVGMILPVEYQPKPNKGRNIAHDVRRGAIIEVINEMGQDEFIQAIDHKLKTGDKIEWEGPEGDGADQELTLPPDIEAAVWRHTDRIALTTTGRRFKSKIDEAFKSYREMYAISIKAHELPLGMDSHHMRRDGLKGQSTDINKLALDWDLSIALAAEHFLELWNGWCRDNFQGRPIAPIGVRADQFAEEDRHLMFTNESGLVPTHMPWIIRDAVAWMERFPCKSNLVPRVEQDAIDHYGRHLKAGTIDMKFRYLAEGREVGAMTIQDFWFETSAYMSWLRHTQQRRETTLTTVQALVSKRQVEIPEMRPNRLTSSRA